MGHSTPTRPQTASDPTAPTARPQTTPDMAASMARPQTTSGATAPLLPPIIQGGMGVAVSDWRLANAVARTGQLGVVSGTAIDVMCVRRLQDGDPGGHVRRALAAFPVPRIAEQLVETYHLDGGRGDGVPYRNIPMFSARPARRLMCAPPHLYSSQSWTAKSLCRRRKATESITPSILQSPLSEKR